jgi:hypothetical protein
MITTIYLWIQFFVMVASAAILQVVDGKAEYLPNGAMICAQVLNCFGFFWFSQFLFGKFVFCSVLLPSESMCCGFG